MLNLTQSASVSKHPHYPARFSSGRWGLLLFLTLVLTLSGLLVSAEFTPAYATSLTPVPGQPTPTPSKSNNKGIKVPRVTSGQDGSVDPSFKSGGGLNAGVNVLVAQSDGKILMGGQFTTYNDKTVNYLVRLNSDYSLDSTFNPGGSGPNGAVNVVVIENDGKLLIGGDFTTYDGTTARYIVRLNSDGTLDTTFNPGGSGISNDAYCGCIHAIVLQSDGKILIGGSLSGYNGTAGNGLARLNPDGTVDPSFHFTGSGLPTFPIYYYVNAIAVQNDGKIIIGGDFRTARFSTINCIARLNPDGSLDDTFNPGGSGTTQIVYALSMQSDGKMLVGGEQTSYNGTAVNSLVRLNSDGSLDTTFSTNTFTTGSSISTIKHLSNGKLVLGGSMGISSTNSTVGVAQLNPDGSLDPAFNSDIRANVADFVTQSNGKILVGGYFTNIGNAGINRIALLNSNGTVDLSFNPGSAGANGTVNSIVPLSNGKILIAGGFGAYNNLRVGHIARLNSDGSLDTSFNSNGQSMNAGADGIINAITMQGDGKILISGYFNTYNNVAIHALARLNPDGTLDTTFNAGSGPSLHIIAIAVQNDGKILVGGDFTSFSGVNVLCLVRLNPDGTIDSTFNPGGSGPNGVVYTIVVQSDGKILLAGNFRAYNGLNANHIARLNSNGSLDPSFVSSGTNNNIVIGLALQKDGKILIGGDFTTYNEAAANSVARLNSNGTLDTSFSAGSGTNSTLYNLNIFTIVAQNDGKILIGGSFTTYNGTAVNRIARLNADGSLDSSFNAGAGANNTVYTIALQNDGKILVGGDFSAIDTYTRDQIARLYNTIVQPAPIVTLTSNPNPSRAGESVIFTATVQPSTATGTVRFAFSTGSNTTSAISTVVNGAASYVTSTTQAGVLTVTAYYSGDANLSPGTSPGYTQLVNPGPPSQLLVVSGTNQQTSVNRVFDLPLVTRVTDAFNNPVGGVVVTFTAPGSGPSLSFMGGSATYAGMTSATGLVASAGFTANGTPGVYSVTATAAGISTQVKFNLINMAVCDSFVVTSTQDDGSCGTLRSALLVATNSPTSKTKTVKLPFPAGTTLNLAFGLHLGNRVELVSSASCGVGPDNLLLPPVILQGGSGDGLTLAGTNRLFGLWVRGFSGVQIKAPAGSHTTMQCVRASKL